MNPSLVLQSGSRTCYIWKRWRKPRSQGRTSTHSKTICTFKYTSDKGAFSLFMVHINDQVFSGWMMRRERAKHRFQESLESSCCPFTSLCSNSGISHLHQNSPERALFLTGRSSVPQTRALWALTQCVEARGWDSERNESWEPGDHGKCHMIPEVMELNPLLCRLGNRHRTVKWLAPDHKASEWQKKG